MAAVDYLLIGGFAAGHCARALREAGVDGSALLVTREPDPPYSRPPLSKGYLRGEKSREDALVVPDDWWPENDVGLLTRTSVMKLDPGSRTARLSNKDEVSYGKALLATGANVRRLRIDGSDLDGIHYLRALGNSDAIREEVQGRERVLLIGGSYIGCEVAASLTAIGKSCTILMQEQVTFEHVFGAEVGRYFQDVLTDHGMAIHGGEEVVAFEGDGQVQAAVTRGGRRLECDLVVIGVGVAPDVTLARAAGLELGDSGGVRCTARLETSAEGVYAAGDIAEYDSEIWGPLRVEHWDVARTHAQTVAANMTGEPRAHSELPYFFSDLADWASLEYVGRGGGEPLIRGSVADGEFAAFYRDEEGRVNAVLGVERSDDVEHARRWITARAAPDPSALVDPDRDLAEL